MVARKINKQLAGMEDIAQGIGPVAQTRNGTEYAVGQIDIPYAVLSESAMSALDPDTFTYAKLGEDYYRYSASDDSGIPANTVGSWILSEGRLYNLAVALGVPSSTLAYLVEGAEVTNAKYLVLGTDVYILSDFATGAIGTFTEADTFSLTIGTDTLTASRLPGFSRGSVVFLMKRYDITDEANIQAASEYLVSIGGGTIKYCYSPVIEEASIVLQSLVRHDLCGNTVTQKDGAGLTIYKTEDFDTLTGVGPLANAPYGFAVVNGFVDGNWLADFASASIGGDTTYNNTAGYGFQIFGSQYDIDVTLDNCAQVGFYTEAVDYTDFDIEQSCNVRLRGRCFGRECVISRGPADICWDKVFLGCPAWAATDEERQADIVLSEVYTDVITPVHAFVSDEEDVGSDSYHGHHEFGMMHLYGNYSGYGYYCKNTGRLKGDHLVVENCRGGFYNDTRTWGGIAMLECHNNGRQPSNYSGSSLVKMYDIFDQSLQGFNIRAVVRRTITQQDEYTAYRTTGKNGHLQLDYFVSGSDTEGASTGNMAEILSESKTVDINCVNTTGNAVYVEGIANKITVNSRNHTSGAVVYRVAGSTNGNLANHITLNGQDCDALIYLDNLVTVEQWNITGFLVSGQTIYESGSTELDMYNRAVVNNLSVRIDNVSYSNRDVGRVNLDNTLTTAQTITVSHTYFQTPDPAQVNFNLYDPSPDYTGAMEYIYLQSVSATELVFTYKLASIGTDGPLVLCWRID